ncbi:hypothetical protein [Mucilaginibacter sp.]
MNTTDTKEEKTHAIEKDSEVTSNDGKNIENEKDVHEIESGNVGEPDAEKDMLDGPSIDLVGQPRLDE